MSSDGVTPGGGGASQPRRFSRFSRFSRFGGLGHLATRFVGSLRPGPPSRHDEAWALSWCLPGESALWRRMTPADRRHAVGVARRTVELLGGEAAASRAVLAAALLHDVGKVEAELGTAGRVWATVAATVGGERAWRGPLDGHGRPSRVRRYLHHDELGARLLAGAGSDPLTVAWAGEHHRPPEGWTVPRRIGEALKAADDD